MNTLYERLNHFYELPFEDRIIFCIEVCKVLYELTYKCDARRIKLGSYYKERLKAYIEHVQYHEFYVAEEDRPITHVSNVFGVGYIDVTIPRERMVMKEALCNLVIKEDNNDEFALDIY